MLLSWRTVTNGKEHVKLDDETDFTLLNSIAVLIDRNRGGNYFESDIQRAIKSTKLKSPGQSDNDINRFKSMTIRAEDATAREAIECSKYGYKLFEHQLTLGTSSKLGNVELISGIRLLIPCANKGGDNYKQLQLCKDPSIGDIQGDSEHYLYHKTGNHNVYVYFYGKDDPRPLLLCYNNNAYRPSSTSEYDSKWVNDKTIQKCGCDSRGGDQILPVLTQVVGVLNTVQLHTRPKKCNGAESGEGVSPTTCPESNGDISCNTCTYEVHTYTGRSIKVKVTCKTERQNGGSSSEQNGQQNGNGGNCVSQSSSQCPGYKTITHEPAGMNGQADGTGFRLGDIVYKDEHTGKVNYYTGSTATNKYHPVNKVTAYYLGDDFEKPLVVVLEFQTSSPPPSTSNEYYKLTKTGEEMVWEKDDKVKDKIGSGVCALFSYLQILKFILNKKIYVILNEHGKYEKEKLNEITDARGKKIEVSIYQPKEITVGPGEDVTGAESPEPPIQYKKFKHTINVDLNSSELQNFPPDAKKDVTLELVPSIAKVTITMFEGSVGGKKAKLTFSNGSSLSTELHVYFYQHPRNGDGPPEGPDTVPLMLQHDKTFYGPTKLSKYFTGWEKLSSIKEDNDTQNIAKELDRVNKALNEINISHDIQGKPTGSYGLPSMPSVPEQPQQAEFKTERIKVTCEKVGDGGGTCPSPPGPPTGDGCTPSPYIKYTHTTVNKYELGQIKYKNVEVKVGVDGHGQAIPVQPTQNLLEVYYLTTDSKHTYPLLIRIGQQVGAGQPGGTYYRLKIAKLGSPEQYRWEQDQQAKTQMTRTPVKYLDKINYQVKKVLKLEIDKKAGNSYPLKGRDGNTGPGAPFSHNIAREKQIQVEDCTKTQCTTLTGWGYKCYQHKLTTLGPELDQIGGIALTLPGNNGGPIEIKLYNSSDGTCNNGNEQIPQLFYNKCMGDMYVFFYHGSSSGVQPAQVDTVPLMLWYNKQYYKPENREKYFEKWVCVNNLGTGASDKPCGKDGGLQLVQQLDEVNRELNRIELDKASGPSYGLPTGQAGPEFSTERVKVTTKAPTSLYAKEAYTRIVHRTKNGFTIGEIKYATQDIIGHGITPGGHINVNKNGNGNHKSLVDRHKWNTVVCYYSTSDRSKVLPQLIVILKTDTQISEGVGTVTSSEGTKDYGYYILSKGERDYEYKWVNVKDGSGVTLNDETDFTLLNSVVILLDKQDRSGYNGGEIKKAIQSAISNQSEIKSPGQLGQDVNRIQGSGKKIMVTDATRGTECSNYGYKVFTHDFSKMVAREGQLKTIGSVELILGVRLLIPTGNNGAKGDTGENGQTQYKQLELCKDQSSLDTLSGNQHFLYYKKSAEKVSVYFYGGLDGDEANGTTKDPRPLLLCYNSKAYRPQEKDEYDTTWTRATSIRQCECKSGAGDQILPVLTQVVGFLNKVELQRRPGGKDCNGETGGATVSPGPTTCTQSNGDTSGNTCKYEVHKYQGKSISVRVTCETIKTTDEATSAEGCYYMSMTHTPNGMNGGSGGPSTNGAQPAKGFRLGYVEYQGSTQGKLGYGTRSRDNKWYPLIQVTTYYYSEDKNYEKPLLVILEFRVQRSSPPGTEVKEYYKLKPETSGTSRLQWEDDTRNATSKLGRTDGHVDSKKLISYLDEIRFGLMKVVQIQIQMNTAEKYELKVKSGDSRNGFRALNGVGDGTGTAKQITVADCTECDKLGDYKCFQHKLTDLMKEGLEDEVGGIKLTVPGQKPGNDVEIPLHRKKPVTEGGGGNGGGSTHTTEYERITPLTYNKCMGDIYVYFYGSGGKSPGTTDTVPLMLGYNNKYYKPQDRDNYFERWIPVEELKDVKPGEGAKVPCGDKPNAQKLAKQLDEVNRELNRIQLEKHSARGNKYGLPTSRPPTAPDFPIERVIVTEKQPTATSAKTYTRIVHRTKNGFTVGKLTSKGGANDITSQGLLINGVSIKAGGSGGRTNNHTQYTNSNKLNTVVVYYSNTDKDKKLPQLMVLMSTDAPVSGGGGDTPIKGSESVKSYGYYIIASKQGGGDSNGSGYEYKWVEVTESTPVTLDDKTDFNLLNSVVILLEQRGTGGSTSSPSSTSYGDTEIQQAVKAASISSPGNSNDVNRIQGKEITIAVNDESEGATTLSSTGFKRWTHDISALVELNGSLRDKLQGVSLIGGLRFLIPTKERGKYKQLKVLDGEPSKPSGDGLIMYHKPSGGRGDNNKVCVFFYQGEDSTGGSNTGNQGDPRPLLFCYNSQGYSAKSMKEYDEQVWQKDVTDCKCDKSGDGKLVPALVRVSNFLNPVMLNNVPRGCSRCRLYPIHWFNGKTIFIKVVKTVSSDSGFCYDRYTHSYCWEGYRLGEIRYKRECIKQTNSGTSGISNGTCITASHGPTKYTPSPEVVTYYYKGDKNHKNPLLVALCKKDGGDSQYTPYYELQRPEPGAGADKKYKKEDSPIDLNNTKTLGDKLDKILFNISQKLQVILDQRPMPRWYSPKGKQTEELSKCNLYGKDLSEAMEERRKKDYDVLTCSDSCKNIDEQKKKLSDYFFYHVPLKTCYEAQLYENDGNPVENNGQGNTQTHYNIGVEEMKCTQLTSKGYRCYKHKLTEVVGIEEVGGLKLYLWANGKGAKTTENGGHKIKLCNGPSESTSNGKSDVTYNICKGDIYVYFYGEDPRPLMLCYDGKGYNDSKLECVDVYYNQYDPDKTPLLFVLQFQGVSGLNKYYKRSEFQPELAKGGSKSINKLEPYYNDEPGLLPTLNNENDKLPDFLMFNITKKGDDGRNTYNDKKIKLFKYYYFINFTFYLKYLSAYR